MYLFNSSRKPKQLSLFTKTQTSFYNYLTVLIGIIIFILLAGMEGTHLWLRWPFLKAALFNSNIFSPPGLYQITNLLWIAIAICSYRLSKKLSKKSGHLYLLSRVLMWIAVMAFFLDLLIMLSLHFTDPNIYTFPISGYGIGLTVLVYALWKMPEKQLVKCKGRLELKDYLTLQNSYRTFFMQAIGGSFILLGLYFTAQSLKVAQENTALSLRKDAAERFIQAVTQLNNDNFEVRLASIYTIERLSSESLENYLLTMQILPSYVRRYSILTDGQNQPSLKQNEIGSDIQAIIRFLAEHDFLNEMIRLLRISAENDLNTIKRIDIPTIDLRSTNLYGASLGGVSASALWLFTSSNLEHAYLRYSHFIKSDFTGTHLQNADLSDGEFSNSTFNNADLSDANLKHAVFDYADLKDASLKGADLEGADFTGASNLQVEQVKQSKNYNLAKLPPDIQAKL